MNHFIRLTFSGIFLILIISCFWVIRKAVNVNKEMKDFMKSYKKIAPPLLPPSARPKNYCNYMTFKLDYKMGLGNLMFGYASLYGIARKNRKFAVFPKNEGSKSFLRAFQNFSMPAIPSWPGNFVDYIEEKALTLDPKLFHISCSENVRVGNYLQSWRYFEPYYEKIRKEFTFGKSILDVCESKIAAVVNQVGKKPKREDCILIGAHMRRGDFLEKLREDFGHVPAKKEYLHRAIEYFRGKRSVWRNSSSTSTNLDCFIFVILGNDYKWNVQNSPIETDVVVMVPDDSATVDLCILSKCNHTIMSTGTFGWWAGFLANGHVTYQKEYATYGSKLYNITRPDQFYLPTWVPL